MAKGGKRMYKKRASKKRGVRKSAGISRLPMTKKNVAKASQILKMTQLQSGAIYSVANLSLRAFDRLTNIGRNYQFYRIAKVVFRFKPLYDMFGQNLAQGSVPYFYFIIDKGYNLSAQNTATFNALRDAGAKPIRLDDKTITVAWRPCVAVGVGDISQTGGPSQTFSMARRSPWLDTNANSATPTLPWAANGTDHRGIAFGVEQDILTGGTTQIPYIASIEVFFEFKDPIPVNNPPGAADKRVILDLENAALFNVETVPTVDTTTLDLE